MTDDEKALALIALLIWAMWRTEQTSVILYQTCTDGSVIPLDQSCPVNPPYVPPDTPVDDPFAYPWGPIMWEDPWNSIYLGN